ncbi:MULTISPECIES: energy-coupling factor ABC transporter ATP-binding protein [Desulfococcus]|jgi:biotin transport system ATP-binding protein|uniref:ABC transporter related protein n=1 Tax=Desulfococcus multivorans DSM 2059 TaxID=1121405 RepID=S7TFG9_DESML|nr:ABC transporter ATP-binding protein [Desulfococcus multivorans]AOY59970.1 CbiO: cobalt import ABC-binding protein [Desulfococcus multivorans]AQV02117.1 ABC transporter ATP-binding protein [Desulfococcus multivorans]EPR35967.1 ABC transporter related protein [Desulfococcus multivorans DSM 2059]MDX9819127.1 ABC transporter ATP-binding protein [Desulfococcus multivorans]SJZ36012.1 biotin transport system ATP-binding protein [Desulfococcus multivorans DSM 2059]
MAILEVSGLIHRFPDGTTALSGIDLVVREGEFVVVAGANGSGKTTFLRHLNALLLPHDGRVLVDGVSTADDPIRARRTVGMVFQDADSQIVGETVYDDVAFGPENLGLEPDRIHRRVTAAMAAVGLAGFEDQRPHLLSGGEKRRVAIAGILAMRSRVLVFDEPFSNLDYPGVRQVLAQIVALHRQGHTILLTTHDLEKVLAHADRLVVISAGRVARNGLPAETVKGIDALGVREPEASRNGMPLSSWLR